VTDKTEESKKTIEDVIGQEYKYGFVTNVESDTIPKGINEDVIRLLVAKKGEPDWMLEWRLNAFRVWQKKVEPHWATVQYPPIDYQAISYYSAPKQKAKLNSLDEVDPEIRATFDKLGIPLHEQKLMTGVAIDAVFDSVSVITTFKKKLEEVGIIFCSFSDAIKEHPALVQKYMGTVVPPQDNFYAALNAAVFTDGSFCWIPKGVTCPMELSTYFRINSESTGQFERTLIVAEEGACVRYNEGCSAPARSEHQLHAAVVELIAEGEGSTINYSTIQNWYPGDKEGRGGIYNFVTKRGICKGKRSKITWTQVETGAAITWKYPSVILKGDDSTGEFYSVAVTNNYQQADTGTKMIHVGERTKSTIVSKSISSGKSSNAYRGMVKVGKNAKGAANFTQCDALLMTSTCKAITIPVIESATDTASICHEATNSKVDPNMIFYLQSRGISQEDAIKLIINGFCDKVFKNLPLEFFVEATRLLEVSLEGSVG